MKKGKSCPVPHSKSGGDAKKMNYATVDREELDVNTEKLDDKEEELLSESVNSINPDMNSMDSRG